MVSRNKITSATMTFAEEDRLLSWYYFLSSLLLTATAFIGTYWIPSAAGKVLTGILAGLLTSRVFVIYHDFHHDAILRKSVIAKWLMTTIGLLTLAPPSIWKETHQHHHNHNAKFSRVVIGSFPTINTETFKDLTNSQRTWYLMLRHPFMILFAYIPIFLVSFCLWPFVENPKRYYDCGIAAMIHVVIAWMLYMLGGWSVVTYSLLIPSVVLFAVGGYIFYAQHNFPAVILKDDDSWDYIEAALYSSSFIKMNRLMHWFTANIGYHHIHHINSRIPFYRLPEAREKLIELQDPRTTSLHPMEIWRCLQLKLWDGHRGRMISLREFRKPDTTIKKVKSNVMLSN